MHLRGDDLARTRHWLRDALHAIQFATSLGDLDAIREVALRDFLYRLPFGARKRHGLGTGSEQLSTSAIVEGTRRRIERVQSQRLGLAWRQSEYSKSG